MTDRKLVTWLIKQNEFKEKKSYMTAMIFNCTKFAYSFDLPNSSVQIFESW